MQYAVKIHLSICKASLKKYMRARMHAHRHIHARINTKWATTILKKAMKRRGVSLTRGAHS